MSLTLHSFLKSLCHLCAVVVVWLAVQAAPAAEPVRKEFDLPADVAARSAEPPAESSA